jgi:hypothetical protein
MNVFLIFHCKKHNPTDVEEYQEASVANISNTDIYNMSLTFSRRQTLSPYGGGFLR